MQNLRFLDLAGDSRNYKARTKKKIRLQESREFDSNIKQVYDLAVGFQGLFFAADGWMRYIPAVSHDS
jgi:hypothetical protein